MKEDVLDEVSAYNGRILLHKEIDPQASVRPRLHGANGGVMGQKADQAHGYAVEACLRWRRSELAVHLGHHRFA
jgi:hypothetical protein